MPKKSWLLLFAELTMNALMQSSQTVSCRGILVQRNFLISSRSCSGHSEQMTQGLTNPLP
jgi:hypothetical protein